MQKNKKQESSSTLMVKTKKPYHILAIDTSCDETASAVTNNDRVLSNVVWSQIEIHKTWGGVVPNLAKRAHLEHIDEVVNLALKQTKLRVGQIDFIAVTQGPGLAPALEVGIQKAKQLVAKYGKPLIAVNHMEGHLFSSFAKNKQGNGPFSLKRPLFPILGLLVSGGHTQLVLMKSFFNYRLLAETLDDAAGEAFDKVAKILELGYPGGPIIESLAKKGNPLSFALPIPMRHHPGLDFSFSGLKTASLYQWQKIPKRLKNAKTMADFAASFQMTLVKSICLKLERAIKQFKPKQLVLGGGVVNNLFFRKEVRKLAKEFSLPLFIPYSKKLFADNAAMIAVAAFFKSQKRLFVKKVSSLERQPNLNFRRV